MLQQMYPQVFHDYEYELNKDMQFAAAHFVPHTEAGKCRQVHGHTYFVNLTVAGDTLDEAGFLVNFALLKKIVSGQFDHTLLNDHSIFNEENPNDFPTTEVVARKIYELVQEYLDTLPNNPSCVQVFVRETPTSYVVYRPKKVKKRG
ncbi:MULTISPECIES: 6-carboxytetrahydropterin synthase QueD [Priestia]|uniref:6-carboxy-5,6,7,8-tetrahydropterin synthase n=1 Tax=Priestia megaterium TaxID=1404 RepID=A0ABD4WU06_PRIMG|nr:6-carboxytetrahydropterin synthase QueD [Priestia megaterium]MCF6795135.1 6-carboxytetrahydropterin synthase QueD [Bacillus sp. ET1]MBD8845879.1 6-carboxytetrahydropterin synthase QueD [Priestia megaterium]MDD9783665.1 6-carboxytetrahydropterin synthase QueD [Priestia megaterium]MDN4861307.1 6-carboxytetrahydropterin synthase QueD [Priestia megaterium]MED3826321.1 6-carboxytetrahydropterin synthase QueD [Priestia megaterium]